MLEKYAEVVVVPHCTGALRCSKESADRFVREAAANYPSNPYHGPIHAAEVCHLSRWLIKALGITEYQSSLEHVAFLIAGLCHDIKHPGRNNAFCITTEQPVALLYSHRTVLESFHSATCMELMESTELLTMMSLQDRHC